MTILSTLEHMTVSFAWVYNFLQVLLALGNFVLSRRAAHLLNVVINQLLSLWAIEVDSEAVLKKK